MAQEIIAPKNTAMGSSLRSATEPSKNLLAVADDLSKPPEHRYGLIVTREISDEAVELVSACDEALRPAGHDTVIKWLSALGSVSASASSDSTDVKIKISAYANVMDFPPMCYTHGTVKRAARKFKFFPTVAELSNFFADIVDPIRKTRFDAEKISKVKIESRFTPRDKRKENPVFLAAMEKWGAVKAELSEREASMVRAIPKAIFKPIHVPNPETDGYAERARALESSKQND